MLLSRVKYARPDSIPAAIDLLTSNEDARVLAGGQTLVNLMKLRTIAPGQVIDVTRIPELRGVSTGQDGWLEIGAATTYAELSESDVVAAERPLIAEVAGIIADVQVRNRGTLGGNVCLNLSTSHFPPILVALDATLMIATADGERAVPANEFFETVFTTAVRPGELLTHVRIPPRRIGQGDAFLALSSGKESASVAHVAASVCCGTAIEEAVVALGCVAPRPLRAVAVERALIGAEPTEDAVAAAVTGLAASLDAPSDVGASSRYRAHLTEVLTRRVVLRAIERRRRGEQA